MHDAYSERPSLMPDTHDHLPRLLIASSNPGKLAEFRQLLDGVFDIRSSRDVGMALPEETGRTFAENAILKAVAGEKQTGLITLADDSGLIVNALNGAPGVYSARYAGEPSNDARNREMLLRELDSLHIDDRRAYFVCAIAISTGEGEPVVVEGRCDGVIGRAEVGTNGFGYDSLFVVSDGRTMAELTDDEKNEISHRGKAVRLALPHLLGLAERAKAELSR